MPTSQNGWTASATLKTRVIEPVKGVRLRVRDDDDVAYALGWVVAQWHKRVEPVTGKVADDWGFAYRANVNSPSSLSNHASGTAVDINATQNPNGVSLTRVMTKAQAAEVREIVAEFDGALRWGGDYRSTVDAMHVEVNVSKAKLAAAVKRHKAAHGAKPDPVAVVKDVAENGPQGALKAGSRELRRGMKGTDVAYLQRFLGRQRAGADDGIFGEKTEDAVVGYQKMRGINPSGVVGKTTWDHILGRAA